MRIINHNNNIKLVYNTKIVRKKKQYKTKSGTNHYYFYQGFLPFEVEEYLQLIDKQLYFYEKDNKVYLTGREPREESYLIRLQKANQYTLPSKLFTPSEHKIIILKVDFAKIDPYMKQSGLISVRLE